MTDTQIDTGDTVLHGPSGEKWSVAFVEGDYLYWRGWPEGSALLSDCTLVRKASADEKHRVLLEMAKSEGVRAAYAQMFLLTGS